MFLSPQTYQEQNDHIVYRMPDIDLFLPPCPGRTTTSQLTLTPQRDSLQLFSYVTDCR